MVPQYPGNCKQYTIFFDIYFMFLAIEFLTISYMAHKSYIVYTTLHILYSLIKSI